LQAESRTAAEYPANRATGPLVRLWASCKGCRVTRNERRARLHGVIIAQSEGRRTVPTPKKTPSKKLLSRRPTLEIRREEDTVADVSKEIDEYKQETDTKLRNLQSQIDELRERLGELERNAE
jgi:adenylate kinase family enzyme